ncbi:MAG TPA: FAD-dependent oxidoreductase [Polyangiaceae bacterium]|jgi:D-amino-acid dehydrogenase|nr:FAD-dependent oxidoreductase [Polyangiaceae bacterium]
MVDVAVIGGGIVGASVAYRLARQGARVSVIDRQDVGQATAAGAGILPPLDHFSGVRAMLPLVREARRHYPELIAALAEDGEAETGYAVVGSLQVAASESEAQRLDELRRECEQRRAEGFLHIGELSLLDGAQARRHFPLLSGQVLRALHATGAARIDGRRLLSALRRALERHGARWTEASAEPALEAGRVVGVRTPAGVWPADTVVVAGGVWSGAAGAQLGLQLPLRPQRGQLVHLELTGEDTSAWPIVLGFGTHYLLSFAPNRIVAGATREDSAGYSAVETAGGVHAVLGQAFQLAPGLSRARLLEARVGLRPVSADGLPILGRSPRHPNLYVATGHAGYGLEVGPYSGALVADAICGRPSPVDLGPFAPERFVTSSSG